MLDKSLDRNALQKKEAIIDSILENLVEMNGYMLEHARKLFLKLKTLPPSGGGGCHQATLGVANHAVRIGLTEDAFIDLIRPYIHGTRVVFDSELRDTYQQAFYDYYVKEPSFQPYRPGYQGYRYCQTTLNQEESELLMVERNLLIEAGRGVTDYDLMMASPVVLSNKPVHQAIQFLECLYSRDEYLYVGPVQGGNLETMVRWKNLIRISREVPGGHIIINPFTGELAPTKGGRKLSCRCDAAISSFRYALAEFDKLPLDDQLAFWSQVELPIVALISSGNKSIHAWLRVDNVSSLEEWDREVRQKLYAEYLIPMDVDSACKNPARLSRMPGHLRQETEMVQQLLYLCPEVKEGPIL